METLVINLEQSNRLSFLIVEKYISVTSFDYARKKLRVRRDRFEREDFSLEVENKFQNERTDIFMRHCLDNKSICLSVGHTTPC